MLSLFVYLVLFLNVSCFYIQGLEFRNIQIVCSTLRFHCSPRYKQHPKLRDIQTDGQKLSLTYNLTIDPSHLLGISCDPFFVNCPIAFHTWAFLGICFVGWGVDEMYNAWSLFSIPATFILLSRYAIIKL